MYACMFLMKFICVLSNCLSSQNDIQKYVFTLYLFPELLEKNERNVICIYTGIYAHLRPKSQFQRLS